MFIAEARGVLVRVLNSWSWEWVFDSWFKRTLSSWAEHIISLCSSTLRWQKYMYKWDRETRSVSLYDSGKKFTFTSLYMRHLLQDYLSICVTLFNMTTSLGLVIHGMVKFLSMERWCLYFRIRLTKCTYIPNITFSA